MDVNDVLGKYEQHRDLLKAEIKMLKYELGLIKPKYLIVMSIKRLHEEKKVMQEDIASMKRGQSSLRFKHEKNLRWCESNDKIIGEAEEEELEYLRGGTDFKERQRLEAEVSELKEQLYYEA